VRSCRYKLDYLLEKNKFIVKYFIFIIQLVVGSWCNLLSSFLSSSSDLHLFKFCSNGKTRTTRNMYTLLFSFMLSCPRSFSSSTTTTAALFELAGADFATAVHVAKVYVRFAVAVDATHVDVALEEHVVQHEERADERRALLRRDAVIVNFQLVQVRVGQHLRHHPGEIFGLLLGDGGDVADVHLHLAVFAHPPHREGLIAAQLGAPAEATGGSRDTRELLIGGGRAVHHLNRGGEASAQDGDLRAADDAILWKLPCASGLAIGLRDAAGVHERLVGAAVHAHTAAQTGLGAAPLAFHRDDGKNGVAGWVESVELQDDGMVRSAEASGAPVALFLDADESLLGFHVVDGVRVWCLDAVVPPLDVLLNRVLVDGAQNVCRLGIDERNGIHSHDST